MGFRLGSAIDGYLVSVQNTLTSCNDTIVKVCCRKSVNLECYEVAVIRDVDVVTSRTKTYWKADINVYLDFTGNEDFFGELKFYAL